MMMQTLSTAEVAELLLSDECANWSYRGARALAEWLEDRSEEFDTPQEFDRAALRGRFSEYRSLREWIEDFYKEPFKDALSSAGIELDGTELRYEIYELIRSYIRERGDLIEFDDGVIVSEF